MASTTFAADAQKEAKEFPIFAKEFIGSCAGYIKVYKGGKLVYSELYLSNTANSINCWNEVQGWATKVFSSYGLGYTYDSGTL